MKNQRHLGVLTGISVRTLTLVALLATIALGATAPAMARSTSDIAIQPILNGSSFYDACFVLVGFSNIGCDDNSDGIVTFRDVPLGAYTVRQTANLGSLYVDDFTIHVTGIPDWNGWEVFTAYVMSSGGVAPSAPIDIALITREPQNGHLLTDPCYVLVGYSNVGCDENGDGQITFASIPPGAYTVRQVRTPAGYQTIEDFTIDVRPVLGGVPLSFIVRQAPNQNAPGTRNFSVVLLDSVTGARIATGICAEIVGASNVGCDNDLLDGQIDFLDVPAGAYNLSISNLPPGYAVFIGSGPLTATIDASPGAPTSQMIFVQVYVPR